MLVGETENSQGPAGRLTAPRSDVKLGRKTWVRGMGHRVRGYSVIVAPLQVQGDNAWQAFLLGSFDNCRIALQWVQRLGLPLTSVADKLPCWR